MYERKLSVVIVNYNVKYFLEQCLYSVRAALSGIDAEIFIVDNNSTDGSVDYLRPKFPEVIFIENKDNPGFAKASNQAVDQCRGEYILLLNPDTVIGEGVLRTLCFFMDEHPKGSGIGVKMLDGHGAFLPESKRAFPTPWVAFCKMFGLSKLFPQSRTFARYSLPYLDENKQHKVDILSGAFMMLRHTTLDNIGAMDNSYFMYGEDIDLSGRMMLECYESYYVPERILHYKGESTKKGDIKYIKAFYGSMLIFYRVYYEGESWFIECLVRLGVVLKVILAIIMRPFELLRKIKMKRRRMLVLCREEDFETVKAICAKSISKLEFINLWDLDSERVMDAICRRNQMKGFTDIAFCYPTVRFEQILLFMDTMVNKEMTYHIYNKESGRLVSPGK